MNLRFAFRWLFRALGLACAGLLALGMNIRLALVNLQKLGEATVANPPWYYVKFHCSDMYADVEWSSPFCFAADLRIFLLVPIASACIGCALWRKHELRTTPSRTRGTARTR